MITHKSHNVQFTSLLQYFPAFNEEEVNQAFRQRTKAQIISLLQNQSMTDREITSALNYTDPNKIRPRRNELVKEGIVVEVCKEKCNVGHRLSIKWGLNREKLFAFIGK